MIGFDQYQQKKQETKGYSPFDLALLMATGIGLHNFGEGLAIGSSFALGEAALGTFLIIGFTLHNITEGIGIAAPLLKTKPTNKRLFITWNNRRCTCHCWYLVWRIYLLPNLGSFILRYWSRGNFTSNLCNYKNAY